MPDIALEARLSTPFDDSIERVSTALAAEGFGILTRIDVHTTLRDKIGAEFRPYVILGACNPPLAFRALEADPRVGLVLPCNVTVESIEGGALVRFGNPEELMRPGDLLANPALSELAGDVRARLGRVRDALSG